MNVDQTVKPAGLNGILMFSLRYSQLSKYTGQGCPQNATVAPGHSTMIYHLTYTVISQDNNTIMCFIHIAAL